MSTFQTIIMVLAAFVIGMSVVTFPKVKKAVLKKLASVRVRREVEDDRKYAEKNMYLTACGHAEAYYEKAEVVWVRLIGGKKYNSVEELFRNESMRKETHLELEDMRRRLENVRLANIQEMYRPSACTEFPTEKMVGKNLFVYKTGDIRISDKLMATIGTKSNGHLDITRIFLSDTGLDDSKAIQTISLTAAGTTKESFELYKAIANEYMTSQEYAYEDEEVNTIYERLLFYNDIVVDQKAVEFRAGRVYFKAHNKLPKVTPRITADEVMSGEVEFSPELRAKDEVAEAIRNAVPHTVSK